MSHDEANHQHHLAQLSALTEAAADMRRRMAVVADSDDDEGALRNMRDALSVPWDPPFELAVHVHSAHRIDATIEGVEHRVDGADLDGYLSRLAPRVRARLARPHRRRVALGTGLTDGPTHLLVDPVGGTEFVHDEP